MKKMLIAIMVLVLAAGLEVPAVVTSWVPSSLGTVAPQSAFAQETEAYPVTVGTDSVFKICNQHLTAYFHPPECWAKSELQEAEVYGNSDYFEPQARVGVRYEVMDNGNESPAWAYVSMKIRQFYSFLNMPCDGLGNSLAAIVWTDDHNTCLNYPYIQGSCHEYLTDLRSATPIYSQSSGSDIWVWRCVYLEPGKRYEVTARPFVANYRSPCIIEAYSKVVVDEVRITWWHGEGNPPVASFTYSPENPVLGQEITFDASSSYDPDGTIASYQWDFGDENTTGGEIANHTYTEAGNYFVSLTVTDNDGLSNSMSEIITVAMVNQPPVAIFTYSPENPIVEENIILDSSSSYDPDGQIVSYNWDFGDESSGEGQMVTHTYSRLGNYTVTLTTTDNDGLQDSMSQIVEVRPIPVVFVHGYYADLSRPGADMWQNMVIYLKNNGYDDNDLFAIELEPGPLPANGDIKTYAGKLSSEIVRVKSLTDAKEVDLVCHSMGGLVARWYTTHSYRNYVRNLIMIGTPNHGSELLYLRYAAKLLPGIWPAVVDFGLGPAGTQMTPYSTFLNTINYGAWYLIAGTDITNPSVNHQVIAGMDDWPLTTWILWGDDDGVVRVESARLDGVNLQTVPYDHRHECHVTEVFQKVLAILQDDPTASQRSSTLMQAQQGNSTIQEAPMISDKIFSGEQKSHEIAISATSEATFTLAWLSGDLALTLTTPIGTTIDPLIPEGNSSISYYQDGNTTKGYIVQNPEPGIWQVNISAVDVPEEGEDYTVLTFLETAINLSLNPTKYQYDPGEQISIVAALTNDSVPLTGASVTGEIQRPDESVDSIVLYDDGLHDDGGANDGVYAYAYANTATSGAYGITVSANGTVDSEEFARQAFATVWVEQYPDLTPASSDISFSDAAPRVGGNITIEATIHNIGDANAGNASVLFYDGAPADGVLIGEDVIDVNAGQTGNASTSWNPTVGQHEIYVVISPFNGFLEKDYTNNEASTLIYVTPALAVETSIVEAQDVDGVAMIEANIIRVKDVATDNTVSGIIIRCYQSNTFYDQAGVGMLAVRSGAPPFDNPTFTIDNSAGNTTFGQCMEIGSEPPITVAKLVPRLTGCALDSYMLEVTFDSITDSNGNVIPEEAPQTMTFQRGDVNGDGIVNIIDAMFGAQYLVGLRQDIHRLNMASVKHDGVNGDIKDIIDCMYIAQYVVGLRDCYFTFTGGVSQQDYETDRTSVQLAAAAFYADVHAGWQDTTDNDEAFDPYTFIDNVWGDQASTQMGHYSPTAIGLIFNHVLTPSASENDPAHPANPRINGYSGNAATDAEIMAHAVWMGLLLHPAGAYTSVDGTSDRWYVSPLSNEEAIYLGQMPKSASFLFNGDPSSGTSGCYVWVVGNNGQVYGVYKSNDGMWYSGWR